MQFIWLENGSFKSSTLELTGQGIAVGRTQGDLLVDDAYVSRAHAVIYRDDRGQLRIKDLSSANGTFVNGKRVVDAALREGDELIIGRTTLRFSGAQAGSSAVVRGWPHLMEFEPKRG